jgi:hypothetical protein
LAEVVRHPLSLAAAYVLNAQVNAFLGWFDEARRGAERAYAISQQQALPIFLGWSNVILGCVAADLERQRLNDALGMFAVSGTRFTASFCVSQVAERFLLAGDTEHAKQLIDLPMRLVGSDDSEPAMAPFVWRVLGLIAAAESNAARAQVVFEEAWRMAQATGSRYWALRIAHAAIDHGNARSLWTDRLRAAVPEFGAYEDVPHVSTARLALDASRS